MNFVYRCFHPKYILETTKKVHGAFFSAQTPRFVVKDLERLLSPYESMCWPMQALFPIVTGPDVIQSISGWKPRKPVGEDRHATGIAPRLLVLAAELDVLCTPAVLFDAAKRYRTAFHFCVRVGKLDGVSDFDARVEDDESDDWDGVTFKAVEGLGHHLQNHFEWGKGAEVLLEWTESLQ